MTATVGPQDAARPQDRFWAADRLGGTPRIETHYGRRMRCFPERPSSLAAMLAAQVERDPARAAVAEGPLTLTYGELDARAARLAAGLAAHGIAAGDRVALLLGNGWEFLALLFACARLGAVVVPIGTRQRMAELAFLLDDCGAKMLVFEAAYADAVPPPAMLAAAPLLVATRGEIAGAAPFAALMEGQSAGPAAAPADEEATAVLLYTSGTTGRPKGACLTHLGLVHSALSFARCFALGDADRGLVAVPLAHVTGLVGVALTTLAVGGCVVLMHAPYKTDAFLALAAKARVSFTILVPAIYTLCAMHPDLARHDLSAWRVGGFGGAPMPVATIARMAEALPGLQLLNAYGATETTSPTTIMPRTCWRDHMDSVGQVVPCGEVRVLDENGQPVPPGTAGELWIAGPMVVPGYWNRPDANRAEFANGFWRSGDIGSMDADGFVRLFDRRKDMINRAGYKIFSAEVEGVLSALPGVQECAIVGRPDPVLGERVHAFVVPAAGWTLDGDAVRAHCAGLLADYKVPETVTIDDAPLPRNANGKVLKASLRDRLAKA